MLRKRCQCVMPAFFFRSRFHFHNGAEEFVSFFSTLQYRYRCIRYSFGILSMYVCVTRKSHAHLKFSMEIPRNGIGRFFAPTKLSIEISYCIYVRIFRQRFLLSNNVSSSNFFFFLSLFFSVFVLWHTSHFDIYTPLHGSIMH